MNETIAYPKPFRDEASTASLQCLACGGPIEKHGFGGTAQVSCPWCGSTLQPEPDGTLDLLLRVERQRRPSALPLHARGVIEGVEWEVIGICWREVRAMGMAYPWQEFVLYNPYEGYRWLIFSMTDHSWMLGGPLAGAAQVSPMVSATWRGKTYKHFSSGTAHVTYVEGEFPWVVQAGDMAQMDDFVSGTEGLSIEITHSEHGADVAQTWMRHVESRDVWAAFKCPGMPPMIRGVPLLAPNRWYKHFVFHGISFVALFAVWLVLSSVYVGARKEQVVLDTKLTPAQPASFDVEFGDPTVARPLMAKLYAPGVSNGWAYADVMLVDPTTEEAIALGVESSAYAGVSEGESWSEVVNPGTATAGAVRGGKYVVQVNTQTGDGGATLTELQLQLVYDVPLFGYVVVAFLPILFFPLTALLLGLLFEQRRWSNSDHANTGSSDD